MSTTVSAGHGGVRVSGWSLTPLAEVPLWMRFEYGQRACVVCAKKAQYRPSAVPDARFEAVRWVDGVEICQLVCAEHRFVLEAV